jgi:hypothetical protein
VGPARRTIAALMVALAGPAAGAPPACTHVIGFSQTREWYEAEGAFESPAGDERWQLNAVNGAGIDRWRDPDFEGWNEAPTSPCASASAAPDRVVLNVTGGFGDREAGWVNAITEAIAVVRAKIPSATTIVLQSVVGGPDHGDCYFDGTRIRDSWSHKHVDAAIAAVAGGDVVVGASPHVDTCADYRDTSAHLTPDGAARLGARLGAFYAAFDGMTTTTVQGGTTTTTLSPGCPAPGVPCSVDALRQALAAVACAAPRCRCERLGRRVDAIDARFAQAAASAKAGRCRRKLRRAARLAEKLGSHVATLRESCIAPATREHLRLLVADLVAAVDDTGGTLCEGIP